MLIPRIFHQIWVGPDPFPDEYARYQRTWLDRHPGWALEFWTEERLPDGLRRPEAAEKLRYPAERANILRLELLWRFGGVYVDTDFECLRSIEPLIQDVDFFTANNKKGLNNALIGSVAAHPVLDKALDQLRPREFFGHNKKATGALFFDRVLKKHLPDAKIFEKTLFYPKGKEERERAYAIHYDANTWKDSARKVVRRKKKKAQDDARRWRLMYEQVEAELARLREEPPSM
jgi:mannosyltransferase OCH1-like enzyme